MIYEGITTELLCKRTDEAVEKNRIEYNERLEAQNKINTDKALEFIKTEVIPKLKKQINHPSAFRYIVVNIPDYKEVYTKVLQILREKGFYLNLSNTSAILDNKSYRSLNIEWCRNSTQNIEWG
jgi:hypothetical protein